MPQLRHQDRAFSGSSMSANHHVEFASPLQCHSEPVAWSNRLASFTFHSNAGIPARVNQRNTTHPHPSIPGKDQYDQRRGAREAPVGHWAGKRAKCPPPFYCTTIVTSLEAIPPTVSLTLIAGPGVTPAGTFAFT